MATIYYHDIGDYLTREQKLKMIHDFRSVNRMEWTEIEPNEKKDWINQRDGVFETMIELAPNRTKSVFLKNIVGLTTARDAWDYNSSKAELMDNVQRLLNFYNSQVVRYEEVKKEKPSLSVEDFIEKDESQISWTRYLRRQVLLNREIPFDPQFIKIGIHRPFFKQYLYYSKDLVESPGLYYTYYPQINLQTPLICVSTSSSKDFCCIMSRAPADYDLVNHAQCLPLYYYEPNTHQQKKLFDDTPDDDYIRRDGITDWILKEVRNRYGGAKNITKEMIFYYVYGLLHSKDYRERFAADLKKSLPRIPIVERIEDFMAFYKAGKQLADLHLNYENVPPHPEVVVHITSAQRADQGDYAYFRVDPKMKFRSKDDKSAILYNANIRLENIPLKAYDYIVNGKSAIEWILERYCISIDKKSLIKNDANDWGREHGKPRYILDLLLSVINVSTQTVDIVNSLPHLTFG